MLFINNSNNKIADIQFLFKNGEKKKKSRCDEEGGGRGGGLGVGDTKRQRKIRKEETGVYQNLISIRRQFLYSRAKLRGISLWV